MGRGLGRRVWIAALAAAAAALVLLLSHSAPEEPRLTALDPAEFGLMLQEDGGLYVLAVREKSPAWRAGFVPGDRIVAVNDTTLDGPEQLEAAFAARKEWKTMDFAVIRAQESLNITIEFDRKRLEK